MLARLGLVVLDRLQEGRPPHLDVLVLHRDHLVKVNRLPLTLVCRGLIFKTDLTRTEWFQMISRGKLVIKNLQLVLNLRVILARTWVDLVFLGDLVHEVSLHR
jgi:hypothetical protein